MADSLIGFELLLHCVKHNIKKKDDILLLLVHHNLLRAGFKCSGKGKEWNNDDNILSEILPNDWNASKEYVLRYKRENEKYVLMSSRTDDVIVFNFTSTEKMKVTNVIFNVENTVNTICDDISIMVPTHEDIVRTIEQQLITPFMVIQKRDMNTQTSEAPPTKYQIVQRVDNPVSRLDSDLYDINTVGRRDLDPLAAMGIGGGMLFDPLRDNRSRLLGEIGIPQRLPRGAVPPHARFDPFGPPDIGIPGRPPPDDMFG